MKTEEIEVFRRQEVKQWDMSNFSVVHELPGLQILQVRRTGGESDENKGEGRAVKYLKQYHLCKLKFMCIMESMHVIIICAHNRLCRKKPTG